MELEFDFHPVRVRKPPGISRKGIPGPPIVPIEKKLLYTKLTSKASDSYMPITVTRVPSQVVPRHSRGDSESDSSLLPLSEMPTPKSDEKYSPPIICQENDSDSDESVGSIPEEDFA